MLEEEMERLRRELNQLTESAICLYSDKIVELSQRLDKLICNYYKKPVSILE